MNSSQLKGFLTGLILGDGHIETGVQKRALSIKSINFDFIEMIEKVLNETMNISLYTKEHETSEKKGVKRKAYKELRTKAHPYFAKKYHYFYNDYRERKITFDALNWLNPEGIANWYMSDGYITLVGKTKGKISARRVQLCLDRYSEEDVEKVMKYFKEKWNWETRKVHRGNGVYRIEFRKESISSFFETIEPFIVRSFQYKLDLNFEDKPSWMSSNCWDIQLKVRDSISAKPQ